jgi:hypothetical protein
MTVSCSTLLNKRSRDSALGLYRVANISPRETSYTRSTVRHHPISIRETSSHIRSPGILPQPSVRAQSPLARRLQQVCRALDRAAIPIEHVCVDHSRTDVFVLERFLYSPDVIPPFRAGRSQRSGETYDSSPA